MKLIGRLSAAQGLVGNLSTVGQELIGALSTDIFIKTQTKTVTPTDETQEIIADDGYAGLSRVTVNAIPNNYGRIIYNGNITVV